MSMPMTYYVEKIVSSRISGATSKREYLVKLKGYQKDFNSYVDKVYKDGDKRVSWGR